MSLNNITFDSDTETNQETTSNNSFKCLLNDENSIPKAEISKKPLKIPRKAVRYISEDDEKICSPKRPLQPAPNGLLTVVVKCEKKKKINGTRYYFRCFIKGEDLQNNISSRASNETSSNNQNQIYIAKAKKQKAKSIPIENDNSIHLRNPTSFAVLETDNENSEFTLIQNQFEKTPEFSGDNFQPSASNALIKQPVISSPKHLMVIKFILPKDHFDGSRKIHITLLGKTDIPSPLVSLPITSVGGYEGRFMIYSVKNAIIVDEKTHSTIITIRKTESKVLEIDTHFNIPPLWLFGLGIAAFLGKKPVH